MNIEVTQFKYREGDLLACHVNPNNEPDFEIGALYEVVGASETVAGDIVYALKDRSNISGKVLYSIDNKFMLAYSVEDGLTDQFVFEAVGADQTPKAIFAPVLDTTALGDPVVDMVNHPSHYCQGKYEVIDVIEDVTQHLHGFEALLVGNILKYVMRYNFKNGVEDLKKARFYLEKLINKLEK